MGEKTPHPTQKPEEMLKRIIVASSNKGDAILLYNKAFEYQLKSLKIRKEIGDNEGLAYGYNNIGSIYEKLGNSAVDSKKSEDYYDKALDYYYKALRISENNNYNYVKCYILRGIGSVYITRNELKKALEYFMKSYEVGEEIGSVEMKMKSSLRLTPDITPVSPR